MPKACMHAWSNWTCAPLKYCFRWHGMLESTAENIYANVLTGLLYYDSPLFTCVTEKYLVLISAADLTSYHSSPLRCQVQLESRELICSREGGIIRVPCAHWTVEQKSSCHTSKDPRPRQQIVLHQPPHTPDWLCTSRMSVSPNRCKSPASDLHISPSTYGMKNETRTAVYLATCLELSGPLELSSTKGTLQFLCVMRFGTQMQVSTMMNEVCFEQ